MHTKTQQLFLDLTGTEKPLKNHTEDCSDISRPKEVLQFCLELVCATGKREVHRNSQRGHFIEEENLLSQMSSLNCTTRKHSCCWRPARLGEPASPFKEHKLSVSTAACSNLLLINSINNSKVLHHKTHTKDNDEERQAIYRHILHGFLMPQKATLGVISLTLRCWGKPFLLMPNLWEARRTYIIWQDSIVYCFMKALWAITGSTRTESESFCFLVNFYNHSFVKWKTTKKETK